MKELIKRLERVIQTGAPDENGQHPISAETVLEVVRGLSEHGTNLASLGTDCISRQAAIDALRKMQTYKLFSGDDMLLIDQAGAQTELMLLPPAEPKRGRWIGKYPITSVCSECGFLIHDSKVKAFAYCPNCGADMREVTT